MRVYVLMMLLSLIVAPVAFAQEAVMQQTDDVPLEAWNHDDWLLVKPKVALIDLDGYFRLRFNYLKRLDFDTGVVWEYNADGSPAVRYPPLDDGHANYSDTSIRLRLQPRINATEQIQVLSSIDIFDNVLLGSTPDSLVPGMQLTPVSVLSKSQQPPRRLQNALADSIVVKRVWARVTALNEQLELRFGRMPDHFGLGMLYNDGDCLDCNGGDNADRVAISFRLYNHVVTPMVDWVAKGPMLQPFGYYDAAPLDAVPWDDTMQYALRINHDDHPDDIRDAVLHGHSIINYGASNAIRLQYRDWGLQYNLTEYPAGYSPEQPPTTNTPQERRDAWFYIGDAYAKFYQDNFELALEAAIQTGTFKDNIIGYLANGSLTGQDETSILKMGAVLEAKYHLRADLRGMHTGLKLGVATGDSKIGFGAIDKADTQRGGNDKALRNFQFSPDYYIDLLMFRRIIGTVTDAFYLRPEIAYYFDDKFAARIATIYSQAILTQSTPSFAGPAAGRSKPMGLEIDGEVTYGLDHYEHGAILASLAGGMLFPLGAFNNPSQAANHEQGSFAWTVQTRLYVTF